MITLYQKVTVTDETDSLRRVRCLARHYAKLPWPRLPCVGEAQGFGANDIEITRVVFHSTNGNVLIELEELELGKSELGYLDELIDRGLTETENPFEFFERNGAEEPPETVQTFDYWILWCFVMAEEGASRSQAKSRARDTLAQLHRRLPENKRSIFICPHCSGRPGACRCPHRAYRETRAAHALIDRSGFLALSDKDLAALSPQSTRRLKAFADYLLAHEA